MAKKKSKTTKTARKEQHPTMFVWDGSIRLYEGGSMLELHTQVTDEEWELIVEDTIKYKVFLECLKQVACPILGESWDEEDDWFRIQLEVAVSRLRNIDTLLVATYDQKIIADAYTIKMQREAKEVQKLVVEMREQQSVIKQQCDIGGGETTAVSNL